MVTFRQSSRRGVRISTPATKTTNPARRPILVPTVSDPIIPSSIPMTVPTLIPTASFNFNGIQYSPYFLTSGDNPGASIIFEVLDGTNYSTWILAITIVLDAKNKLSFVGGSLPRSPENHPHYRIWSRCSSMVKS